MAEADGYDVGVAKQDLDLTLTRTGQHSPSIIVACVTAGEVSRNHLRQFQAALVEGGVSTGWFVCTSKIATNARAFAKQNNSIIVIDEERLLVMLREVPAILLNDVLQYQFK